MEATGRKASSDAKTEDDNARETSKVAGGGRGEDLDSGAVSDWDLSLTKLIQEEGKRIAREKNIDDFSGTPKWCFTFMKREGLRMRT